MEINDEDIWEGTINIYIELLKYAQNSIHDRNLAQIISFFFHEFSYGRNNEFQEQSKTFLIEIVKDYFKQMQNYQNILS